MALLPALKQGLRIAGRIDQKYNLNKIFIQKYVPPGYRKTANRLVDIAGTLGGGYGIVKFVESLYAPDTPGNSAIPFKPQKQFRKYRQSYKTRYRRTIRCNPERTNFSATNYRRR